MWLNIGHSFHYIITICYTSRCWVLVWAIVLRRDHGPIQFEDFTRLPHTGFIAVFSCTPQVYKDLGYQDTPGLIKIWAIKPPQVSKIWGIKLPQVYQDLGYQDTASLSRSRVSSHSRFIKICGITTYLWYIKISGINAPQVYQDLGYQDTPGLLCHYSARFLGLHSLESFAGYIPDSYSGTNDLFWLSLYRFHKTIPLTLNWISFFLFSWKSTLVRDPCAQYL